MDRFGYDKRISTGTVATVGTLGSLMPPSVGMVIYGLITETSIGKLFLAGIIPGLIVAFTFVLTLYFWCKLYPAMGPKGERSTWKQRFAALPPVIGVLVIFVVVIGGIMMGYFSPSESASVGVFAVLVLVVAKREMDLKRFMTSVMHSIRIGCMVLTLIASATVLGHFFAVTRMPYMVAEWLGTLPIHGIVIIMIILLALSRRGVLYRRRRVLHSCHTYFLPDRAEARLRPGLVRCCGSNYHDDRDHPSSHGGLCVCSIGYYQGAACDRL